MIKNSGEWATFEYTDEGVIITQPAASIKTPICGKWWVDEFNKNRKHTVTDLDAHQAEIDAVRDFTWSNPYK